jgi:hypothetical protein
MSDGAEISTGPMTFNCRPIASHVAGDAPLNRILLIANLTPRCHQRNQPIRSNPAIFSCLFSPHFDNRFSEARRRTCWRKSPVAGECDDEGRRRFEASLHPLWRLMFRRTPLFLAGSRRTAKGLNRISSRTGESFGDREAISPDAGLQFRERQDIRRVCRHSDVSNYDTLRRLLGSSTAMARSAPLRSYLGLAR